MQWNGYNAEEFEFEGRKAIIVFPDNTDKKKSWALKTEYWGAFPDIEIMLLQKGYHVAYLKNASRWALDSDCALKARFACFLQQKYGLNKKCVPIGMSAGGAHAINFASLYPELISCLLLEAPVVDFASCPAKGCDGPLVWENEFLTAYPFLDKNSVKNFYGNPVNRLHKLIENEIPAVLVYGDKDEIVIWQENSAKVIEAYSQNPNLLIVMLREGKGHHPHGFLDKSMPIVENIIKMAK